MSKKIYILPVFIIVCFIGLGLILPDFFTHKWDKTTLNNINYESAKSNVVESNPSPNKISYIMAESPSGENLNGKNVSEVNVNLDEHKKDIVRSFNIQMEELKKQGFNLGDYYKEQIQPENIQGSLYNVTYKNESILKFSIWSINYSLSGNEVNFDYDPLTGKIYKFNIDTIKTFTKKDAETLIKAFSLYLGLGNIEVKENKNSPSLYGIIPGSNYKIHSFYGDKLLGIHFMRN